MKIKSDFSGLKKLAENTKKMQGETKVKPVDLMTPDFIKNCSEFKDLEHIFNSSDFKIGSTEDFAAIPDDEWEEFIINNTTFESWIEMQKKAFQIYAKKQLLKGI